VSNKALFIGFIVGAVILGIAGFLLAPSLLGLIGVGVTHTVITNFAVNNFLFGIPMSTAGVTAAAFGQLQAGIALFAGLIGGLAGGLIGVKASKMENNSALERHTSLPSVAPIANEKATGFAPELDFDGQDTEKSFVKNYKLEKARERDISAAR